MFYAPLGNIRICEYTSLPLMTSHSGKWPFGKMSGGLRKIFRSGPRGVISGFATPPPCWSYIREFLDVVNMKEIWRNMSEIWRNMWKIWTNKSKIWRNMSKYDGICRKYEGICQKYEGICKNMNKYVKKCRNISKICTNKWKIWRNMSEYDGICRKYEGICQNMTEYVEYMQEYVKNMKKSMFYAPLDNIRICEYLPPPCWPQNSLM